MHKLSAAFITVPSIDNRAVRLDDIASTEKVGLAALLSRVNAAQQYHDTLPHSHRRSTRWVDRSGSGLAKTERLGPETWDFVKRKLKTYWDEDAAAPHEKFARCKDWLSALRLWDPNVTWEELNMTAEQMCELSRQRSLATLAQIPNGRRFVA